MTLKHLLMEAAMVPLSFFVIGCATSDQNVSKTAPIGFITTPASYYSSAKARYLGAKYKENLDRVAERIVRNPKTASLQFANNIASVGGIGFFTHSATNIADERFLEVIVSAPDTFETKGDFNSKVLRMFSAYGTELLSILAGDPDILQEKEVSGYGLNLTWRSIVPDSNGTRVTLERAVIYFAKEKVRGFLHQELDQNKFLADAIIFTAEENGPMNLVSYRQQDPRPDTRLPIHEESLAVPQTQARTESRLPSQTRVETGKEIIPPSPAASDRPSTANASGSSMLPAGQPVAEVKAREQVAGTKSPERAKEDSGVVKQNREASRNRPPESAKSSDRAGVENGGPENSQTAVLSKSTTGAQPPPINQAQPKVEQKHAPLTSEQVSLAQKNSLAGSQERERPAETGLPAQGNRADMAKPMPNPIAKTAPRRDPHAGATADAPINADATQNSQAKNRDVSVAAKSEVKVPNVPALSTSQTAEGSSPSTTGKPLSERIALQKDKASETVPKPRAVVGPSPKALEGYVIQLGFNDRGDAQHWADMMERRGYAVSVTEAGGVGSVRVRLGNFLVREEAERQLTSLKQEGLTGIVINLPQAYRPETRTPTPEKSATQSAQPHN
jgi:hypothetical protein